MVLISTMRAGGMRGPSRQPALLAGQPALLATGLLTPLPSGLLTRHLAATTKLVRARLGPAALAKLAKTGCNQAR